MRGIGEEGLQMWYIEGIGLNSYKMKGQGRSYLRVWGKVLVETSRGDRFGGIGLVWEMGGREIQVNGRVKIF